MYSPGSSRDFHPPNLMCCLPLSRFLLDSPDLSRNSENKGKKMLIFSILLQFEGETLRITLSYPILYRQVSPLKTAAV